MRPLKLSKVGTGGLDIRFGCFLNAQPAFLNFSQIQNGRQRSFQKFIKIVIFLPQTLIFEAPINLRYEN